MPHSVFWCQYWRQSSRAQYNINLNFHNVLIFVPFTIITWLYPMTQFVQILFLLKWLSETKWLPTGLCKHNGSFTKNLFISTPFHLPPLKPPTVGHMLLPSVLFHSIYNHIEINKSGHAQTPNKYSVDHSIRLSVSFWSVLFCLES